MPERKTIQRARKKKESGKAPTTQAGEFVREEMEHVQRGKHGARSPRQAIAIGLSKARRAGVAVPPPKKGQAKEKTRRSAQRALKKGQATGQLSRKATSARRATQRKGSSKRRSKRS